MQTIDKPKAGTTKQTATGGTVTYMPWGLIHKAGNNYTGKVPTTPKDDDWDL